MAGAWKYLDGLGRGGFLPFSMAAVGMDNIRIVHCVPWVITLQFGGQVSSGDS